MVCRSASAEKKRPRFLFVIGGHFILNISNQRHPHLGDVVSPKHVADEMCFDGHLNLRKHEHDRQKPAAAHSSYHL